MSDQAQANFIIPLSALVNKSTDLTCVWVLNRERGKVEKINVIPKKLATLGNQNDVVEAGAVEAGTHHIRVSTPGDFRSTGRYTTPIYLISALVN